MSALTALPRRAADAVGRLRALTDRVRLVEEAVAENRPLEEDLVRRVAALERRVRELRTTPSAPGDPAQG